MSGVCMKKPSFSTVITGHGNICDVFGARKIGKWSETTASLTAQIKAVASAVVHLSFSWCQTIILTRWPRQDQHDVEAPRSSVIIWLFRRGGGTSEHTHTKYTWPSEEVESRCPSKNKNFSIFHPRSHVKTKRVENVSARSYETGIPKLAVAIETSWPLLIQHSDRRSTHSSDFFLGIIPPPPYKKIHELFHLKRNWLFFLLKRLHT